MQKHTTIPLLLKGFVGVVLLWQTACTNTPRMGMDGKDPEQTALKNLEKDCLGLMFRRIARQPEAAPLVLNVLNEGLAALSRGAESGNQQTGTRLPAHVVNSLTLREELASSPWHHKNLENLQVTLKALNCQHIVNSIPLVYNSKGDSMLCPLIAAAFMLLEDVPPVFLETFIENGGDINSNAEFWRSSRCWSNYSLLSFAAKYGHFQALRFLLEKGADASRVSPFDIVPYILRAQDLNEEEKGSLYRLAIEKGLDIKKLNTKSDRLSCKEASSTNCQDLNTLLKPPSALRECFPPYQNNARISLLHRAAFEGNIEKLNILLSTQEIAPSLYQKDGTGNEPWKVAAIRGYAAVLRVLMMKMRPQNVIGLYDDTKESIKSFLEEQANISPEIRQELKHVHLAKYEMYNANKELLEEMEWGPKKKE